MSEERLTRIESKLDKVLEKHNEEKTKTRVSLARIKVYLALHNGGLLLIGYFAWEIVTDYINKKLGL